MKTNVFKSLAFVCLLITSSHMRAETGVTNLIDGATVSEPATYMVGTNGAFNTLIVTNAGAMTVAGNGIIGNSAVSSNNGVWVTGPNSVWKNSGDLYVGRTGSYNQLTIQSGGVVSNANGIIGYAPSSRNNAVLISGPGSVWSNSRSLRVGAHGFGNRLTVTNGGQVFSVGPIGFGGFPMDYGHLFVGEHGSGNSMTITSSGQVFSLGGSIGSYGNNNTGLVTGAGSVWITSTPFGAGVIFVGEHGSNNSMAIADGGQVFGPGGYIGYYGNSNKALVTGAGSVWNNSSEFGSNVVTVGSFGAGNSLTVANGGQVSSIGLWVGYSGSGNGVVVTNASSIASVGLAIGTAGGINNRVTLADHSIGNLGGGALVWGDGAGSFGNSLNIDATSALTNIYGLVLGENNTRFYMTNSAGGFVLNGFTTNQLQFSSGFGPLTVGAGGSGTALIMSNYVINSTGISCVGDGGFIVNARSYGFNPALSNNSVLVTGPGTAWNNNGLIYVGYEGSGNSLVVTNAGSIASVGLAIGTDGGRSNSVTLADHSIGNLGGGALVWGGRWGSFGNSLNIDATSALTNIYGLALGENNTTFYMTNSAGGFVLNGFTTNQLRFSSGFGPLTVGAGGIGTVLIMSNYVLSSTGPSYIGHGDFTISGGFDMVGLVTPVSDNSVLIAGPGTVWSNNGLIYVGHHGSGNRLVITNGGSITSVGLAIGTGGGINNQVTLTDHSIGNLGGGALMWGSGPGAFGNTLNIDATSALTNIFGLSLGEDNTTFYMTNSPSGFVLNGFTTNQLQFANGFGELVVGSGANGTALVISNYVLNSAGSSRIGSGYNAGFGGGWNGNNNSVLIAGPASVWSNSGPLVVGFWGCGNSLIITNGGQVFDADGHIGIGLQTNIMIRFYPDPPLEFVTVVTNNFVLVAGTGSTWNNSGDIYVGTTGSWNQLTIASGGQVFSANGYVGYDSNAVNNAVSVAGPGSVWNISGSLNVGYSGSSNSLTIADSGTVTASNVVIGPMDTSIGNLVTVSGGSLLVTNSSGGGLLDIRHGTLNLNDGLVYAGAVAVSNGSFLIGSGTIIGSVTNAGTMNPGNSPGTLNVQGDLTLLSSTVLDMELRGTATNEFDRLLVSGAFTADGILDVMLLDGFLPQPGDQFDLLNYASVSGGFDSMNLPFGVGSWDTTHLLANPSDPLSGTIIYIPEPSVSALMALGLAALGMRRRK